MNKSYFARETVFALTIFSDLDLHLFHNRSLAQYQSSELFFFLPSQSSQFHKHRVLYASQLRAFSYREFTHLHNIHTRIYTRTIPRDHTAHVLSFAWVLVRGMKRDGVAEEGKERTKRERLGSVCGVGVSVWVPQQPPPLCPNTPPRPPSPSPRCCCCCCYHPPYAAWRWSTV